MGKASDVEATTQSAAASSGSTREGEVTQVSDEKLKHADAALGFIENHASIEYTPEQEKKVLRKIDKYLMPLVCFKTTTQIHDRIRDD